MLPTIENYQIYMSTTKAKKPKGFKSWQSEQLRSERRKLERRAKGLEKLAYEADVQPSQQLATAHFLREQAKGLSVTELRKTGESIETAYSKAASLSAQYPTSARDIAQSEKLARQQLKLVSRELMVFTYDTVWKEGMTTKQREEAIRREAATQLGIPEKALTTRQLLDYYEKAIGEYISGQVGRKITYKLPMTADGETPGDADLSYLDEGLPLYFINGSPIRFNIQSAYAQYLGN